MLEKAAPHEAEVGTNQEQCNVGPQIIQHVSPGLVWEAEELEGYQGDNYGVLYQKDGHVEP